MVSTRKSHGIEKPNKKRITLSSSKREAVSRPAGNVEPSDESTPFGETSETVDGKVIGASEIGVPCGGKSKTSSKRPSPFSPSKRSSTRDASLNDKPANRKHKTNTYNTSGSSDFPATGDLVQEAYITNDAAEFSAGNLPSVAKPPRTNPGSSSERSSPILKSSRQTTTKAIRKERPSTRAKQGPGAPKSKDKQKADDIGNVINFSIAGATKIDFAIPISRVAATAKSKPEASTSSKVGRPNVAAESQTKLPEEVTTDQARLQYHGAGIDTGCTSKDVKLKITAKTGAQKRTEPTTKIVRKPRGESKAQATKEAKSDDQQAPSEAQGQTLDPINHIKGSKQGAKSKATAINSKFKVSTKSNGDAPETDAKTKANRGPGRPRKKAQDPKYRDQPQADDEEQHQIDSDWNEPTPVSERYSTVHPEKKKDPRNKKGEVYWLESYTNNLQPLARRGRARTPTLVIRKNRAWKKINLDTMAEDTNIEDDEMEEVDSKGKSKPRKHKWEYTRSPPLEALLPKRRGRKSKPRIAPVYTNEAPTTAQELSPKSKMVPHYSSRRRPSLQNPPRTLSRSPRVPSFFPLSPTVTHTRGEPATRRLIDHGVFVESRRIAREEAEQRLHHARAAKSVRTRKDGGKQQKKRKYSVSFEDSPCSDPTSPLTGLSPPIVISSLKRSAIDSDTDAGPSTSSEPPSKRTRHSFSTTFTPSTKKVNPQKRPLEADANDEDAWLKSTPTLNASDHASDTPRSPKCPRFSSSSPSPSQRQQTPTPKGVQSAPESPSPGFLQSLWEGMMARVFRDGQKKVEREEEEEEGQTLKEVQKEQRKRAAEARKQANEQKKRGAEEASRSNMRKTRAVNKKAAAGEVVGVRGERENGIGAPAGTQKRKRGHSSADPDADVEPPQKKLDKGKGKATEAEIGKVEKTDQGGGGNDGSGETTEEEDEDENMGSEQRMFLDFVFERARQFD